MNPEGRYEMSVVVEVDGTKTPPEVTRAFVMSPPLIQATQYLGGTHVLCQVKGATVRADSYEEAQRLAFESVAYFPWLLELLGDIAVATAKKYRAELERKVRHGEQPTESQS